MACDTLPLIANVVPNSLSAIQFLWVTCRGMRPQSLVALPVADLLPRHGVEQQQANQAYCGQERGRGDALRTFRHPPRRHNEQADEREVRISISHRLQSLASARLRIIWEPREETGLRKCRPIMTVDFFTADGNACAGLPQGLR